jgi:hypothetical protein
MRRGYPTRCCGVVLTGGSWPVFVTLHGLDFELVSFVHITVHTLAQTDRPDLGGAPSQFPTVGKSMPRPVNLDLSRASYSVLWCNTFMDRESALDTYSY